MDVRYSPFNASKRLYPFLPPPPFTRSLYLKACIQISYASCKHPDSRTLLCCSIIYAVFLHRTPRSTFTFTVKLGAFFADQRPLHIHHQTLTFATLFNLCATSSMTCFTKSTSAASTSTTRFSFAKRPRKSSGSTSRSKLNEDSVERA